MKWWKDRRQNLWLQDRKELEGEFVCLVERGGVMGVTPGIKQI